MEKEGKYIYCIINTNQERNFGPIGVGGRNDEVLTIGYNDISMVISNHSMSRFVVNSENMLAHEKVIEIVMKEFDSVLPVRYGTVASSTDEIRNLIDRRYSEFKNFLRYLDHKIELAVKGIWKNMNLIFKEITNENKKIKKLKEKIQNKGKKDESEIEMIGKMVKSALLKKKEKYANEIVDILKKSAIEYKINNTTGDEMFMNSAFLVDKGWEKEFDNIMDDLSDKYKDKVKFMYTGPLAPFNFVNIVIYPEEWEK